MKALILNGSRSQEDGISRIGQTFTQALKGKGWDVDEIVLRTVDIAPCMGCFSCWLRKPSGICIIDDPGREVARKYVSSDMIIVLSPVTFGGYSWHVKKALDRLIPIALPYFETVDGETHHMKRYQKEPSFIVLGLLDEPDCDQEMVFRNMVERNIRNLRPAGCSVDVLAGLPEKDEMEKCVQGALERVLNPSSKAGGKALLMTGSPKKKKSTTAMLGAFLCEGLSKKGFTIEKVHLGDAVKSEKGGSELASQVGASDLIICSLPLYVDSLPAPVIRALEMLQGRAPEGWGGQKGFTAIVQCGFPEAFQNWPALEILRTFCRKTGLRWMGGLAIGEGAMIDGQDIVRMGGVTKKLRSALENAAEALAAGNPIPFEALDAVRQPFIPAWLYFSIATVSFTMTSKKNKAYKDMYATPYAP